MAEQVRIDHEELRTHANKLDSIATDISVTATNSGAINLHDGAFGVMMAWLPGVVEQFNPVGSGSIQSSSNVVRSTAEAIRMLADDFHDTDQQIADAMNAIKG